MSDPSLLQAAADALRGVVTEMDCHADAELVELRAQQWEAEAAGQSQPKRANGGVIAGAGAGDDTPPDWMERGYVLPQRLADLTEALNKLNTTTESRPVVSLSVCRAALIDAARNAVVHQHHELFRAAQGAVGVDPFGYEALSERTKRLQHNQLDPLADAALRAVLPLIADAIERGTACPPGTNDSYDVGVIGGLLQAARLVRSFAGEAS